MKRKDVLDQMVMLCTREGIKPWDIEVDEFCEELLGMLEELGMKPKGYINPIAINDPEIDTDSKWGYVNYIDKYPEHRMYNGIRPYEYRLEGWEPEEEEEEW